MAQGLARSQQAGKRCLALITATPQSFLLRPANALLIAALYPGGRHASTWMTARALE